MTVEEFLAWPGDGTGRRYELVDGELRAQEATTVDHGAIHANLTATIRNHLRSSRPGCLLVVAPGIEPHLRANWNFRIPDLGVTCSPPKTKGERRITDPVLLIEILSESNRSDTLGNIPLYSTLPSVAEILIVDSLKVSVELLQRQPDGNWPRMPVRLGLEDSVMLASINLEMSVAEIYEGTSLLS
ncbi:MAG: Uma2 family endonuclease [Devosia sp.]